MGCLDTIQRGFATIIILVVLFTMLFTMSSFSNMRKQYSSNVIDTDVVYEQAQHQWDNGEGQQEYVAHTVAYHYTEYYGKCGSCKYRKGIFVRVCYYFALVYVQIGVEQQHHNDYKENLPKEDVCVVLVQLGILCFAHLVDVCIYYLCSLVVDKFARVYDQLSLLYIRQGGVYLCYSAYDVIACALDVKEVVGFYYAVQRE